MASSVARIATGDPTTNRALDNVRDVVNPLVRTVADLQPAVQEAAPTAVANSVGKIVIAQSAGGAATIQMCCQNSAGAYEWVTLGTST